MTVFNRFHSLLSPFKAHSLKLGGRRTNGSLQTPLSKLPQHHVLPIHSYFARRGNSDKDLALYVHL
jgi:hypothetical protein